MFHLISTLAVAANLQAAQPIFIDTPELLLELKPRTAAQMGSFYEARGFPKPMLEILKKQCFITVSITNKSKNTVWMNVSNWQFLSNGKKIKREHRDYWKARWKKMDIPLNKQSTFRWTLIPETLDYLPGEREGGNIILPFTEGNIFFKAEFSVGKEKYGKKLTITHDKLFCARDTI